MSSWRDGVPVPARRNAVAIAAVIGAVCVVAATRGWDGMAVAGAGVLMGLALAVDVELPQGGTVPMGHAVVIAAAFKLEPRSFVVAGLVCLVVLGIMLDPHRGAASRNRLIAASAAVASAAAAAVLFRPLVPSTSDPASGRWSLLAILGTGAVYLAVDFFVASSSAERRATVWRQAAPVYVSLLCSAAVLGMASGWMLLFAVLPVLMTQYSFQRYSAARRTYEQTIQALGIVPELAGHVALGHGERSSVYAAAIAAGMDLPPAICEHVRTAARLHHIGHVSVPDCEESHPEVEDALVAMSSARILRESGFLAEIADLVEGLRHPQGTDDDPATAALRLAITFDDLVGEDAARAGGALAILAGRSTGESAVVAVTSLRRWMRHDPQFVLSAIAAGEPLTAAAAAASAAEGPAIAS